MVDLSSLAPLDDRLRDASEALLSSAAEATKAHPAFLLFRPTEQNFYHYGFDASGFDSGAAFSWPEDRSSRALRDRLGRFIEERSKVHPDWELASGRLPELELPPTVPPEECDRLVEQIRAYQRSRTSTDGTRGVVRVHILANTPQSHHFGSLAKVHDLIAGNGRDLVTLGAEDFVPDEEVLRAAELDTLAFLTPLERCGGMSSHSRNAVVLPVRARDTRQFLGVVYYFDFDADRSPESLGRLKEVHAGLSRVVVGAYEEDFRATYRRFHAAQGGENRFVALAKSCAQYFNVWLAIVLRDGHPTHVVGWPSLQRPTEGAILDGTSFFHKRSCELRRDPRHPNRYEGVLAGRELVLSEEGQNTFLVRHGGSEVRVVRGRGAPELSALMGKIRWEDMVGPTNGSDPYAPKSVLSVERDPDSLLLALSTPVPEDGERDQVARDISFKLYGVLHSLKRHTERSRTRLLRPRSRVPWERIPLKKDVQEVLRNQLDLFQDPERKGIRPSMFSLLLSGPPGTGKTYLGERILQSIVGEAVQSPDDLESAQSPAWLRLDLSSIGSSTVNETERVVGKAFDDAIALADRLGRPVGLLLDELDQLAPRKGRSELKYDPTSTIQQKLSQAEQTRLLVIGTLNDRERLEPALRNRFWAVELDRPDLELRRAMLAQILESQFPAWSLAQEDLEHLAERSGGWAYRDMSRFLRELVAAKPGATEQGTPRRFLREDIEASLPGFNRRVRIDSTGYMDRIRDLDLDFEPLAQCLHEFIEFAGTEECTDMGKTTQYEFSKGLRSALGLPLDKPAKINNDVRAFLFKVFPGLRDIVQRAL